MKKYIKLALLLVAALLVSSCSIETDTLEDAKVYTTTYPINYLTKEDTDKLFSIISLEDFVKMVHDGGCMAMTEFFDSHEIKYESNLIY